MIRKSLVTIVAATFGLSACANGTIATIPPVPVSTLNAEAAAIIADAEELCGFEAEYASVVNLIPIYGTDVTSASADICAAGAAAVAVSQRDAPTFTALVAKPVRACRVIVHNGQSVKVCGKKVR